MSRINTEELLAALDEQYLQLADIAEMVEAQGKQVRDVLALLKSRDATNVLMLRHTERLMREKEDIERVYGRLMLTQARGPNERDQFQEDINRYMDELRKKT